MGSFLSFFTRFRNREFRQKRMAMVPLSGHDRHHQRPDQQPPDQRSPGLSSPSLQQRTMGGFNALPRQLLPRKQQLYIIPCLQSLCHGRFHLQYLTAYDPLVGPRAGLGILYLLCPGLCRRPLSAGRVLRRNPGIADRLDRQPRIPATNRNATFIHQPSSPCLK